MFNSDTITIENYTCVVLCSYKNKLYLLCKNVSNIALIASSKNKEGQYCFDNIGIQNRILFVINYLKLKADVERHVGNDYRVINDKFYGYNRIEVDINEYVNYICNIFYGDVANMKTRRGRKIRSLVKIPVNAWKYLADYVEKGISKYISDIIRNRKNEIYSAYITNRVEKIKW